MQALGRFGDPKSEKGPKIWKKVPLGSSGYSLTGGKNTLYNSRKNTLYISRAIIIESRSKSSFSLNLVTFIGKCYNWKAESWVNSFIQENSQSLGEPFHLNSCDNYSLESSPQLRPKNFMWPSPHSPLVMSPSLPCSSSSSCPSSSSCAPHSPDHASCVSSPGVSLYHHLGEKQNSNQSFIFQIMQLRPI